MKSGDRLATIDGRPVWTFGDLQYQLDRVDRNARGIALGVERGGEALELAVALPVLWWWTDLTFRQSTVEPRLYFGARALTETEKQGLGLRSDGFACEVTRVDEFAKMVKSHELRVGDVVFGVDGVERDDVAPSADLFIKLRKNAGDSVALDVLRAGKRIRTTLKTYRMSFRK